MYYSIFASACRGQSFAARAVAEAATSLPARLNDAGDLSLQRQFTKADTAEIKFAQVTAGPAATFAARVAARLKLRLTPCLCNQ